MIQIHNVVRYSAAIALVAAFSTGCGNKGGEAAGGAAAAAAAPSPAAQAAADQKWATCVTCHGEKGDGSGAAAAALNPKPRDFRAADWQKSVDDATLAKTIVEGGMAVGKSALMPPNPDLKDKPEVVAALVQKIRGLAQ
jgi:cytochrome c553